jgi:hypothetical protein
MFRDALLKISLQWTDTQQEIAYGELSSDDLSELFKGGQKVAWPLLGIGSVAEIVNKIKRGNAEIDYPHAMIVTDDDIVHAMALLNKRCSELNKLIQGPSPLPES